MQETPVRFLGQEDLLEKNTPVFLGFPCGSDGKESICNVGDLGSIPRLGRSPREGKHYPAPVFWLGKSHGVTKNQKPLGDFHFCLFYFPEIYMSSL